MFPIHQIESFYRSQRDGLWLDDEYPEIAILCEHWLLGHLINPEPNLRVGSLKPAGRAIQELMLQESKHESEKRLQFAMAMALSIPNEKTTLLYQPYYDFLEQNAYEISDIIWGISQKVQNHPGIDVYQAFKVLPDQGYYALARNLYVTEIALVRLNALARDDVDVFRNTLVSSGDPDVVMLNALMEFPIKRDSEIYRALINTPELERRLFIKEVNKLRISALHVDERYGLKWPEPDKMPPLPQGEDHQFAQSSRDEYVSPINDPEFSSKVMAQAWKVTGCIFDFQPDNLRCEPNDDDMETLTQALIKAGLSPQYLMSNGVFGQLEGQRDVSLKQALEKLKEMGPINWSYYRPLYREFLKLYKPQEILDQCSDPKVVHALYEITRDAFYLEHANSSGRDAIFSADLGL